MAVATPGTLGTSNNAAYANTNFLRVFSGEVLTAFERMVSMKPHVKIRSISQGSSAKFPSMGRTIAAYHVPGTELTGDRIALADKIINVDGLLLASTFWDDLEEVMNHFDVRSESSNQLGEALAIQYDRDRVADLALAADVTIPRITSETEMVGTIVGDGVTTLSTGKALAKGLVISQAALAGAVTEANGNTVVQLIFSLAEIMSENHIPKSGRALLITPHIFNLLMNSTKAINRDWNPDGNGSIKEGTVFRVAGFELIENTSALGQNLTGLTTTYNGTAHGKDLTNYGIIAFHKSATGVVQLKGLTSEMEYDIRRQGTLMVSKFALGGDFLRPEAVIAVAPGA